ncbi:actin-related protein 8-like isoform X1 [Zingiber officinale]|uniref:actin-related protein 8-like isoform X1 n=1 Tax=Zingiber officinale TaxID=94328 RepID=UPI001C4C8866|nr:actin-related protein 8-like isoform X1 [Zingiber officinale]
MRRRSSIPAPVASPNAPCLDHPAFSYLRQILPRRVSQLIEILLALVVRKVWGFDPDLTETDPSLGSWPVSAHDYQQPLSLGDLDRLPTDVIVQILKLLGPKEAAGSSLVCSSWRVLVSDNRLWIFFLKHGKEPFETVMFAETQLRSGPMMYLLYSHQVSFLNIFARRAMVPGSIIVDGGSGYCKYGWSKYAAPSGRCATFLEFGNLETPTHARFRHFFSTIFSRMQVRSSSHPIIVSLPICHTEDTEAAQTSRRQLREAIYSVLFDMNAPAVCAVDQAVLALYAARRTSGIVVNIGFNVTSVVPVFRGEVMYELGIEVLGFGASKITAFLKELMQQRNIIFQSLYTVRTIKEKLCYVATDYNAELLKDSKGSCEVASEGLFTLAKERFQTGEILFQPHIARVHSRGLHEAVAQCIDHCFSSEVTSDDGWYKTVVLAGGTSCLPGLPERLDKELLNLLPPQISEGIKVIPPPYGTDSAWFGAKILSNVSTFCDAWCITRDQFAQKSQRNI